MWLLNTARAELKFFASPEDVPGGYAILSHVWNKDPEPPEQTEQCKWTDNVSRDFACDKIREFCELAFV